MPTYPVVAVALILGFAIRRTRLAAFGFLMLLTGYLFVYGLWHVPNLGFSFGPRGLVDFMPAGMILFAAALSYAGGKARAIAVTAAFLCTLITMQLTVGQIRNRLAPEGISSRMYWGVVSGSLLGRHLHPRS